jgi:hypothetical protein
MDQSRITVVVALRAAVADIRQHIALNGDWNACEQSGSDFADSSLPLCGCTRGSLWYLVLVCPCALDHHMLDLLQERKSGILVLTALRAQPLQRDH